MVDTKVRFQTDVNNKQYRPKNSKHSLAIKFNRFLRTCLLDLVALAVCV